MHIKKIGIVANIAKEKSSAYVIRLRDWLLHQGLQVFLDDAVAIRIGESTGLERSNLAAAVDLIVVFGGDGTMLRVARAVCGYDIPILGINIGGLGYLTEVNLNEMINALGMIIEGNFKTEKRMMLDVVADRHGETVGEGTVLNEVVINRANLSRIVELETAINDNAKLVAANIVKQSPVMKKLVGEGTVKIVAAKYDLDDGKVTLMEFK